MVFPSRQRIIFVHGCFWHQHKGCPRSRQPLSRVEFWQPKFATTRRRDSRNIARLRRNGWKVLIVWECQVQDSERLTKRIETFMES